MDLKTFIRTSILEVMGAIHEAQVEWRDTIGKGAINPVWDNTDRLSEHVQVLDFDIAVSVAERTGVQAAPGIQVVAADVGAGDRMEQEKAGVSRIKFSIPVVPPVDIVIGGNKTQAPDSDGSEA